MAEDMLLWTLGASEAVPSRKRLLTLSHPFLTLSLFPQIPAVTLRHFFPQFPGKDVTQSE